MEIPDSNTNIEDWSCQFLKLKTIGKNEVTLILLMKITNSFEDGKIEKKEKNKQTEKTNKRQTLFKNLIYPFFAS